MVRSWVTRGSSCWIKFSDYIVSAICSNENWNNTGNRIINFRGGGGIRNGQYISDGSGIWMVLEKLAGVIVGASGIGDR